jgi:hypothetical protein
VQKVKWRYVCEEKLYAIDIETYVDTSNFNRFVPYSVGTWFSERPGVKYKEFFGENCMELMAQDLIHWKKTTGIRTILTFNGRGFDYNFILAALQKEIMQTKFKVQLCDFICNGSSIMQFRWGKRYGTRSFDLYSFFVGSSLARLCKEFRVDESLQKASFPHEFVRSYATAAHVGEIPHDKFWPEIDKIPRFEQRVEYFQSAEIATKIWPERDQFNLREFGSFYLKKDVLGMLDIYVKFAREVYDRLRLNICMYVSAPGLAYDMFRTSMSDYFVPLPPTEKSQEMFQLAVYGGRVYPRKLMFRSKYYDDYMQLLDESKSDSCAWENLFTEFDRRIDEREDLNAVEKREAKEDFLCDMDVVSLYPTAMLKLYPCGKMYEVTKDELDILNEAALNNPSWLLNIWDIKKFEGATGFVPLEHQHGIFYVDMLPNKSLLEPVVARRNEKHEIVWDLEDIKRGSYTTIDLWRALKRGYKITHFYEGIVFQGVAPLVATHIEKAKNYKQEGDLDPVNKAAIRSFGKLILNSTYGKFLQRPRFEKVSLLHANDVFDFMWSKCMKEIIPIDLPDHYFVSTLEIEESERLRCLSKPTYLGAFVLSHSRLIMDTIYTTCDPCGNCVELLPYYGDTDSLIVPASALSLLDEKGLIANSANKQFGQVSNENGDARILSAYFIGPKSYAFQYVLSAREKGGNTLHTHLRFKGVPSKHLNWKQYEKLHDQRVMLLQSGEREGDASLVRISFDSFLRTGPKQRVRSFKPQELLRVRIEDDELALHALHYLQNFENEENCSENDTPLEIPAPLPKTCVRPLNVLLTKISRSVSKHIWLKRHFDLELNASVPMCYDFSQSAVRNCCKIDVNF